MPPDEYLDPLSFIAIPGLPGRFPLWLSAEPLIAIGKLAEAGKCVDGVPSFFIGYDENHVYRGMAWLAIDNQCGVLTSTAMRCQRFPVLECDALHEILIFQIHDLLLDVINGSELATPLPDIDRKTKALANYVTHLCSGSTTHLEPPRDA